jgi:ferrous iron transport protein A
MKLIDLKEGDEAIIKKVNSDPQLKHRFNSFGVMRGVNIKVKTYSLAKQTVEIEINRSLLALRFTEAEKLEVQKI